MLRQNQDSGYGVQVPLPLPKLLNNIRYLNDIYARCFVAEIALGVILGVRCVRLNATLTEFGPLSSPIR